MGNSEEINECRIPLFIAGYFKRFEGRFTIEITFDMCARGK
jgi:hypothetical protein